MADEPKMTRPNGSQPSRLGAIAGLVALLLWGALVVAWLARALSPRQTLEAVGLPDRYVDAEVLYGIVFAAAGLIGLGTWLRAWRRPNVPTLIAASLGFLPVWQAAVYFSDEFGFFEVRVALGELGPAAAFFIGLIWVVWYVERRWSAHIRELALRPDSLPEGRIWNPFHPRAWYYGRGGAKLNQSLAVLTTYSVLFFVLFMLAGQMRGCREVYELPGGGGRRQAVAQTVKIQKVIRRKFILNKYSSVIMHDRPVDDVPINFDQDTRKPYSAGDGDADNAGLAGGTKRGKVRFIRLEYSGGDWNQDFGIGADLNMLIEYGVRTGWKVEDKTESFPIPRLDNFDVGSSPPLVYLTGQKQISLTKGEIKTLRTYLLDKHGMLFIDNGGSSDFHRQAFAMMRQIVPEIEPVKVPLDDLIYKIQYTITALPYVAPHGGRDAYGWRVDGRWIAYYHPGDIGDAWSDDHSGVPREVWEACYQLGVNVIYYAHDQYHEWLKARMASR